MSVTARNVPIASRTVQVQGRALHLDSPVPKPGSRLSVQFSLPPARGASAPLCERQLSRGLVLLSTLPNIEKHACALQIVHLEEHAAEELPEARVVHVSSDDAENWQEVDEYHGNLTAAGYTLDGASEASRRAFCDALGVSVRESQRVAHGLFALQDGVFIAAEVPDDQMDTPDVHAFLSAVHSALGSEK